MKKEEEKVVIKEKIKCGGGGAVYGLGMIGAFVYYIQNATGTNEVILGIVKSVFWPAFLLHKVLTLVGM